MAASVLVLHSVETKRHQDERVLIGDTRQARRVNTQYYDDPTGGFHTTLQRGVPEVNL